jgi:hypothetical protein
MVDMSDVELAPLRLVRQVDTAQSPRLRHGTEAAEYGNSGAIVAW